MQVNKRTVFTGADIVSLSETMPQAEAVCVSSGRIEAMGSREDILNYAKTGTFELIDLGGGVLYPGFIDTHSHLSAYSGCLNQVYCGGPDASIAGVCAALRAKAADDREDWVLGYGYDDTGIADKRHLTRQDLDAVRADKPVFVVHISVHLAYGNTLALEKLGLNADTRIPGGEVVLDERGQPTGLLLENAAFHAFAKLPAPGPEETRENIAKAIAEYNRHGFTSFMDGGIGFNGNVDPILQAYAALAREGRMNARGYLQMVPQVMDRLYPMGLWHFASDFLTLGGVKYFTDGSIQGFTAALLQDYHTRPGFKGELLFPLDEIEAVIAKYHKLNMQVAVHVNGDRALETTLTAFEKAVAAHPRTDLRHMLVHAQLASDDHLKRMKACGIIPTLFSRHIEVWGDRHAALFLGPERTARMNPAGSCVRLGMPFSLHVVTPVLPVTALGGMHVAVNRVSSGGVLFGPDQRISPQEALKAYTVYAAMCCGGEQDRGRIEPGRYADFVLLSDRIDADPAAIKNIKVRMTICGGRIVHQA